MASTTRSSSLPTGNSDVLRYRSTGEIFPGRVENSARSKARAISSMLEAMKVFLRTKPTRLPQSSTVFFGSLLRIASPCFRLSSLRRRYRVITSARSTSPSPNVDLSIIPTDAVAIVITVFWRALKSRRAFQGLRRVCAGTHFNGRRQTTPTAGLGHVQPNAVGPSESAIWGLAEPIRLKADLAAVRRASPATPCPASEKPAQIRNFDRDRRP